ncbi:MAG: hypothetical protein ACFFD2_08190 [Promethearchaeota archaeon]
MNKYNKKYNKNLEPLEVKNIPRKEIDWDIRRVTVIIGGVVGIILSILSLLHILGPFWGFIPIEWVRATIEIIICCVIIIGYGVIGWNVYKFYNFVLLITVGAIFVIVFGNLAGIILIAAALFIALAS